MVRSSKTRKSGDDLLLTSSLKHDLAQVLDKDFGHKGSFVYSENHPDAPNPFLAITDVGPISLPLPEIDAKRIIARTTQASFGPGTSTLIDRDPWQIDPSHVSFQNPTWDSFLQSNTANICSGLGLPGGYDIQCKLHKLLLYETGSHFRRHQYTQKEDGIFATMVIDLPSQYTGGEIVVSHGSTSEVIDVSASCTSVSVLSWYTDVMHEVKPIRSGHRLVLSYNLMRRSLSRPDAVLTRGSASELGRLHRILERWGTGGYRRLPKQHMVAYVLGHQYSESDLDMGQAALKGQDVHKVNQICWVADMLGFELWLAKFKLYTVFEVEDDSGGEETWIPERQIHSDCTLEYITDLKGNRVHGRIEHFEGLIRASPDYMGDPDDQKFERSQDKDDESSAINNYYHRTALVILNREDMDRVMIIACGVEYGLAKLQPSSKQDNATPKDRKIIDLLLQDTRMDGSNWKALAEFSLRLHDLDLWKKVINRAIQRRCRFLITKEEMFLAWDIFGFQQVQSSYDAISAGYDGDTIDFIHEVKARAARLNEQEIVAAWCDKNIVAFVKGFNLEFSGDMVETPNILISIAKEDGIRFLKDFAGCSYECKQFARLLMSEKENICAAPANEPGRNKGEDLAQIFGDLLDKCIRGPIQYLYNTGFESAKVIDIIVEVVELCIATNRVGECATSIFRLVWDDKNDALQKLMLYYIPITLRLRTRLPELGTSLLSPPFATFARNVIGYYLTLMLGSKTHNPRPLPQMPLCNKGCSIFANLHEMARYNKNCSICANLYEFLEQSYVPVRVFSVPKKTREHFVNVVSKLSNFISFTEVTRGRSRIGKYRDFFNSNRWEYRLEQARDFLKSIGDDKFIEQLMGDRFESLKVALEGKSSYNYTTYG